MHLTKHAVVCLPAGTLDKGLRMKYLGKVDVYQAQEQHRAYCQALEHLGFTLIKIPADNRYPDSVFVEDPGVIIEDVLIITRLRLKERQGEEGRLAYALGQHFSRTFRIKEPGFVEGGDVVVAHNQLYIGLSKRTNKEGAEQLAAIAKNVCGYKTNIFEIPKHFLHLKGGVTYHGRATVGDKPVITVTEEIADHFSYSYCELIVTPDEERFGANCISDGDIIFIHAGRTKTRQLLEEFGFNVHELSMSEFEKIDGALTCLSKLFIAPL